MKVTVLEQVDSTATYAQQQLKQGVHPPLTVIAHTQTAGRGRYSKFWESPKGNIYLTLAFKFENWNHPQTFPLWTGTQVCLWLAQRFEIEATLKWPNDILFRHCKLGGILCESPGERILIVSCGLNINTHPNIQKYPTTSLLKITQKKYNAVEEAHALAKFITQNCPQSPPKFEDFSTQYNKYSLPQGSLWQDETHLYHLHEYTKNGEMILGDGHKHQHVISAHHPYILSSQNTPHTIVDIGNSRIKAQINDQIVAINPREKQSDIKKFFNAFPSKYSFFGSVNQESKKWFQTQCQNHNILCFPIPKRPINLKLQNYPLSSLGIDRLAAMEGYLSENHQAALIVSMGTAITIDIVINQSHLGGFILPGITTALNSLSEKTDQLPALSASSLRHLRPATSTPEAMLQGVVGQIVAFITQIQQNHNLPNIILTGGDAHLIAPHIQGQVQDNLILIGYKALWWR